MYRKVLTIAALSLATTVAHAQSVMKTNKPFSFGGALGAAIPTGTLSNGTNTGYNGTLTLGLNTPSLPVGFRIDGAYNHFGIKTTSESIHVFSVTGNVVYNIPIAAEVRPYLIGGAGLYNTGSSVSGTSSSNDFGFNVGGGLALPLSGFNAFVEARYNQVQTNGGSTRFVPVTVGVMF